MLNPKHESLRCSCSLIVGQPLLSRPRTCTRAEHPRGHEALARRRRADADGEGRRRRGEPEPPRLPLRRRRDADAAAGQGRRGAPPGQADARARGHRLRRGGVARELLERARSRGRARRGVPPVRSPPPERRAARREALRRLPMDSAAREWLDSYTAALLPGLLRARAKDIARRPRPKRPAARRGPRARRCRRRRRRAARRRRRRRRRPRRRSGRCGPRSAPPPRAPSASARTRPRSTGGDRAKPPAHCKHLLL